MAEEIIVLMADLDDESQELLSGWYRELLGCGFVGRQTKDIPYHISVATFSLDKEREIIKLLNDISSGVSSFWIDVNNIKTFSGDNVLYFSPAFSRELSDLRNKITIEKSEDFDWVPHITILLDDAEAVNRALPLVKKAFRPFRAKITRLHLCAFWPTREILTIEL